MEHSLGNDPLLEAFDRAVSNGPDAPLILGHGRISSRANVDRLANTLSRRILSSPDAGNGRRPEGILGLAVEDGPGFLSAFLAARRSGRTVLLMDGRSPADELERVAGIMGARQLLRCHSHWPVSADEFEFSPVDPGVVQSGVELPSSVSVAVLKLTSGSTGTPRGIRTSSRALLADESALYSTMGLDPSDRILATVPMSHSYGFSSLVLPALVRGICLVVPVKDGPFSPLVAAAEAGATIFPSAPAFLHALLKVTHSTPWPESIRLVISAGARLPPETARQFREHFGLPIHVFYGSSECGGICFDRAGDAAERGTVGTPVDGVEIGIEDGRISVRSPAVADGYHPEADARLSNGRFLTSDLGEWAGGEIALRGRQDDQINVRGKKVSPKEVDEVIARLEGVDEAVTFGVSAAHGGEIVRSVVACRPGRLTRGEVLHWCRARLASHKVPRSIILVERIPRTSRGKLDRPALLALTQHPAHEAS